MTFIQVTDCPSVPYRIGVISHLTPISWPSKSPDLSCLDYWSINMAELRRSLPATLTELKATVAVFAVEEEEVTRVARHIMKRARACRAEEGSDFEYKLKKILKSLEENKK